ncbi:MAG: thioredoxin, partial [Ilumatobacteraceae bacterium]
DSPFTPLSVARGFAADTDTVTVFAGEGPRCVVDQKARTAEALANSFASCLRTVHHPKLVLGFDAVLVIGPEHARVLHDDGWDRDRLVAEINARLLIPGTELVAGADGMTEGVPAHLAGATLPKFRPGGLLVVHAGGEAGLFSAIIAGWANGTTGSQPVTREVRR